ncbi:hypothetical protein J2X85_001196 [Microbacterium trichothecenolyticum]|nr:hypothetical protein [Microbacterium trichothecenolyticum]
MRRARPRRRQCVRCTPIDSAELGRSCSVRRPVDAGHRQPRMARRGQFDRQGRHGGSGSSCLVGDEPVDGTVRRLWSRGIAPDTPPVDVVLGSAASNREVRVRSARGHRGQSRGRCCAAKASWHSSPLVGSRRGASFYRAATGPTAASAPAGFAEYIAPDWLPLPIDHSSPQSRRRHTRQCHSADLTPVAHHRYELRSARGDIRRKVVGVVARDMEAARDTRLPLLARGGGEESRTSSARRPSHRRVRSGRIFRSSPKAVSAMLLFKRRRGSHAVLHRT